MTDRQRKGVGKAKTGRRSSAGKDNDSISREELSPLHAEIANWLKTVRFRKTLFGADEQDVWKKIAELDELYSAALQAERSKYEALLEQMGGSPAVKLPKPSLEAERPLQQPLQQEEQEEPYTEEPQYDESDYREQQQSDDAEDFFIDEDFLLEDDFLTEPESNTGSVSGKKAGRRQGDWRR